jgi:hypothetical protein
MDSTKRPKTSESVRDEDRLRKLFTYIGDFGLESLGPHITKLVSSVTALYDQHKALILHIYTECVCCLPHKAHIYAQVHSSLSGQIADFHEAAGEALSRKMEEAGENFTRVKSIVRFVAYLVRLKVSSGDGLVRFLQRLLASGTPDSAARYGYLVVISLFIAGEVLESETVTALLVAVEELRKNRSTVWKALATPLKGLTEDHLDWGFGCLKALVSSGWKSAVLPSYTLEASAPLLSLPVLALPSSLRFFPRFRLAFALESSLSESDGWYAQDLLTDQMHSFKDSSDLMAENLLKTAEDLDASSLLGYILAEEAVNKASTLPLVLLSTAAIRMMPSSPEVMKATEASFSYFLAHCESVDIETQERLCRFYSHFISNFQSVWSWVLVPEELSDAGLFFLRTLVADLARLIEMDRLSASLPERLHVHFPSAQEPILRYADIEESVENTDCQLIVDRIQSKATGAMMKTLLSSKEICNSGDFLLQIFSECLFFHGAKSLLHVSTYLERYSELMHTVKAELILEALAEVWRNSGSKLVTISKKLLVMGLIRPEDLMVFAQARIEAGDKRADWNRWEWVLLEHGLHVAEQEKTPLADLLRWASDYLQRTDEAQRVKVRARLGQLLCMHRPEVTAEVQQAAPAELQTLLVGCRALQVS